MPPKSSAKKRREGKQAATAAEDRDNSVSSKESESAAESARALDESFKENEYAAESARVLDEALDLITSDKQKQTLLKVVTKLTNLTPVQIQKTALLIQRYGNYSDQATADYVLGELRERFIIEEGEGKAIYFLLGMAVDQDIDAGTIRFNMELAITKLCQGILTEHELAKSASVETPMLLAPLLKQT